MKMPIEGEEFEIPQPPLLPIGPEDGAALQTHTYRGKVIACSAYFPATKSGGIYAITAGCWFCWGPATAEEFREHPAAARRAGGQDRQGRELTAPRSRR